LLLEDVKNARAVQDTDCRSAAGVDQMLPEYRLHQMKHWAQTVVLFHVT